MTEKNIHKHEEAALTADDLEMINGGDYGNLLKPMVPTYMAICECGYQKGVIGMGYGQLTCPQCNQPITRFEAI